MDILHLIDRLEEVVADARKLPVGGGVVISRQRLLDVIDRMRVAVPKDVYDSRDLLERQEEVLRSAHEDAEMLLSERKPQEGEDFGRLLGADPGLAELAQAFRFLV